MSIEQKNGLVRGEKASPVSAAQQSIRQEDTIDLLELLLGLLDHWKLIVAAAALGAVVAALITVFCMTPVYQAKSTIYVVSRGDSVLNLSDLQMGTALTDDYVKVFNIWEVHEQVISELDLDYTYSQIASMLSVTNDSKTRMLEIKVTSADPEEAADIANTYAKVGSSYIAEKMRTDEPTVMSMARVPTSPISPNKQKNVMIGFLAGLVLSGAVVVLRVLLDDTYKSAEDIRQYTGLVVLASVPLEGGLTTTKEKKSLKNRFRRVYCDIRRRLNTSLRKKA